MDNMGLIDHPLSPKIVAWLEAVNKHAAYATEENAYAEMVRRDLLNAALEELKMTDAIRIALENCVEVMSLVEHPRFVDPDYGEEVRHLGERIGFGALMSSASASWRQYLAAQGYPLGGEFVAGPCYATVIDALKKAREALEQKS